MFTLLWHIGHHCPSRKKLNLSFAEAEKSTQDTQKTTLKHLGRSQGGIWGSWIYQAVYSAIWHDPLWVETQSFDCFSLCNMSFKLVSFRPILQVGFSHLYFLNCLWRCNARLRQAQKMIWITHFYPHLCLGRDVASLDLLYQTSKHTVGVLSCHVIAYFGIHQDLEQG